MASLCHDAGGFKRVQFVAGDGSRKTVSLGKKSDRDAGQIEDHIEALNNATIASQSPPRPTAEWLAGIGDKLHARLARAGLCEPRAAAQSVKLAEFIDGYIKQRSELRPSTLTIMRQSREWLIRFMGENREIDQVSVTDADAWHAFLIKSGLGKATYGKRCKYVRHFYDVAKRRGLVDMNPFSHIACPVNGDPARRVFVPADVVAKVIDQAPDPQWKLLIALGRWGGLRVPSEPLALKWGDIDLAGKRFIVRAPKTASHKDGGIRIVPMFAELADLFQRVYDQAPEGSEHVITRYRLPSVNLRTQLLRYIELAGHKPWPKLWMNLRVSRATELADLFPSHVCAAWLGHSEKVAESFYRQVIDSHFASALQMQGVLGVGKKPAHFPTQQMHAEPRTASQVKCKNPNKSQEMAIIGANRNIKGCTRQDSKNPAKTLENTSVSETACAESYALPADIREIVSLLMKHSPADRQAILSHIKSLPTSTD